MTAYLDKKRGDVASEHSSILNDRNNQKSPWYFSFNRIFLNKNGWICEILSNYRSKFTKIQKLAYIIKKFYGKIETCQSIILILFKWIKLL